MQKPWLLLDVDGVLNVLTDPNTAVKKNLEVHYVQSSWVSSSEEKIVGFTDKDTYDNYRSFAKTRRKNNRFSFSSDVNSIIEHNPGPVYQLYINPIMGEKLLGLTDKFNLAWATTWLNDANDYISPLFGLPQDLPVVDFNLDTQARGILHWKTKEVLKWTNGTRFLWFDDEVTKTDRKYIEDKLGKGHSRSYTIGRKVGIMDKDLEFARNF